MNHIIQADRWHLPGQRMVKTSAAVTLCLLFYSLLGFQGGSMPAEAAITAVICVQPYLRETRESGRNRLWGTLLGAVLGFLFLLGVGWFPTLGERSLLLYPLMGLGTLIALHSALLLKKPEASGLAAIVFLCVVVAYPDVASPLRQAFLRILDVMLGTSAAVVINSVRLPRIKQNSKVFFVPMEALSGDRFARLDAPVLFRLQSLIKDGAKICLTSRHAPAFQTSQLGEMKCGVPMIVMDGAAIYDPNENEYTAVTAIHPASCRWLMKRLEDQSYFIYTIHRDRNFIYHHGELTPAEDALYRRLKRSPFRCYLDDDRFSLSDVVYIKLIAERERAERLQRELAPALEKRKLRSVVQPQPGEEICGLCFYAAAADMEHAKSHLMQLLRREDPGLEMCDLSGGGACSEETDALRLLQAVAEEYEPLSLRAFFGKKGIFRRLTQAR